MSEIDGGISDVVSWYKYGAVPWLAVALIIPELGLQFAFFSTFADRDNSNDDSKILNGTVSFTDR